MFTLSLCCQITGFILTLRIFEQVQPIVQFFFFHEVTWQHWGGSIGKKGSWGGRKGSWGPGVVGRGPGVARRGPGGGRKGSWLGWQYWQEGVLGW